MYMGHYVARFWQQISPEGWNVLGDDLFKQKTNEIRRRWEVDYENQFTMEVVTAAVAEKSAWFAVSFECVEYNVGYLNAALGYRKINLAHFKDVEHVDSETEP